MRALSLNCLVILESACSGASRRGARIDQVGVLQKIAANPVLWIRGESQVINEPTIKTCLASSKPKGPAKGPAKGPPTHATLHKAY